jgi:hypothetical protein
VDEIVVVAPVRKVGNSLAVLIPAKDAKRAHISEGVPVRARVTVEVPEPLGLLKGIAKGHFDRKKEGLWRDRI